MIKVKIDLFNFKKRILWFPFLSHMSNLKEWQEEDVDYSKKEAFLYIYITQR